MNIVKVIRVWHLAVALVVLVAGAIAVWLALTREPDHPLSRYNYRRIVPGMTRDEVSEILGGPPGPPGAWFVELIEQEWTSHGHGNVARDYCC
jgi:hypothetical protein